MDTSIGWKKEDGPGLEDNSYQSLDGSNTFMRQCE